MIMLDYRRESIAIWKLGNLPKEMVESLQTSETMFSSSWHLKKIKLSHSFNLNHFGIHMSIFGQVY